MRVLELLSKLTGILGMGLAIAYLFAVFLAFQPGFAELTYLFVGRSDQELPLVALSAAVPYILLLVHLGLRSQLGGIYLRRGYVLECVAYTTPRLKVSLLRSATEAAYHRLFLAQALIRLMRYREAIEVLEPNVKPPKRLKSEFDVWRLETYLRLDNLMKAKEVRDGLEVKRDAAHGRAWAAAAEIAAREGDAREFQRCVDNALWSSPGGSPRLTYSRCVAANRGLGPWPEGDVEPFLSRVPGARLEWQVLTKQTQTSTSADERSRWVAEQIESQDVADHGRTDSGRPE